MLIADIQRKMKRVDILCWGGFLLFLISLPMDALEVLVDHGGWIQFPKPTETWLMLFWFAFFFPFFGIFFGVPATLFFFPVSLAFFFTVVAPIESHWQHKQGESRNKTSGGYLALFSMIVLTGTVLIPLLIDDIHCLTGYYVWVASVLTSWSGLVLANK